MALVAIYDNLLSKISFLGQFIRLLGFLIPIILFISIFQTILPIYLTSSLIKMVYFNQIKNQRFGAEGAVKISHALDSGSNPNGYTSEI